MGTTGQVIIHSSDDGNKVIFRNIVRDYLYSLGGHYQGDCSDRNHVGGEVYSNNMMENTLGP
jgi:hypothetical protein